MVLSSTSVLAVDWAPNNGCHQCLWPQGEFWLPPASPGASLRSTSLFWPSFLSNYFFCPESQSLWDVCVCVHMCAPFNSPLALRSYLPGAHHPVEGTQVGSPLWGWSPQSLGIASAIVIILPFVGCLLRSLGLDFPVFLPFLPILWFLFYIFNCGSFLLASKLLSLTVSL